LQAFSGGMDEHPGRSVHFSSQPAIPGPEQWLHNWLKPRVNCSHLAADLVQDVFVRVMSAADAAVKLEAVREPKVTWQPSHAV
jgi:RNA polymerase sigma-70 factor (ECF subfamily)